MLKQVVLSGTGKRAQLNGYTSAGKTGTAWKFDSKTKRVDSSKYVSSFIGMAPADNPEVVIVVVIDEPKSGARDGGMVAAPVFKAIADQMLPILGVQPDGPSTRDADTADVIPETTRSSGPDEETGKTSDKSVGATKPKAAEPKSSPQVKKDVKKAGGDGRKVAGNTVARTQRQNRSEKAGVT